MKRIHASSQVGAGIALLMLVGVALASPTIADGAHRALDHWRDMLATSLRGFADHIHSKPLEAVPVSLYVVPMSEEGPDGGRVDYRLLDRAGLTEYIDAHCSNLAALTTTE